MDYTVEGVNVRTLGGADTVTTGDLDGLKTVNVDLGAFDGGDDGAADDVIVGGTDGDDEFDLGDNAIAVRRRHRQRHQPAAASTG